MILRDFHTHTTFCDGKNTPEEMVLSAIEKNMETIGLCHHSYTFYDESYCIKKEEAEAFKAEVALLKEKYAGKINILCGVEQDFYSDVGTDGYDYVIGSVHYLKKDGKYYGLDNSAEKLKNVVEQAYNGDWYLMAEDYYNILSQIVEKTGASIIGHFDLITKFNEGYIFFDETDERYVRAYKQAVDKLVTYGVPFEINTGAISRGYRTSPYPAKAIIDYIRKKGGKTILSSDAHSAQTLCYKFEEFK